MYRKITRFMQMGPARQRRIPKTTEPEYDSDPIEWEPRRAKDRRRASAPRQPKRPSATPDWRHLVRRAGVSRRSKHPSREQLRQLAAELIAACRAVTDWESSRALRKALAEIIDLLQARRITRK